MLQAATGTIRVIDYDFGRVVLDNDLELDSLGGHSKVTRTRQGLMIETELQTTIQAECGRCLTEFPHPLKTEFSDLYVFSHKDRTDDDLVMPEDGFVDLGPIAREQLLLEIPINLVCKPDCKGLCSVCGANKNIEEDCGHVEDDIDPRMAKLRSLLKDS
jgi:uncharacterized protein